MSISDCIGRIIRWLLIARKPSVFLSSTGTSMQPERSAVQSALSPEPYRLFCYEFLPPQGKSPESVCKTEIDGCDVFLCIIGHEFGSEFPDSPATRSIVHWEFDNAHQRFRNEEDNPPPEQDGSDHPPIRVSLMTYIKENAADLASDPRQRIFIKRISDFRTGVWTNSFRDAQELGETVARHMSQWLWQYLAAFARHEPVLIRLSRTLWLSIGTCLAAIAVTAAAACLHESITFSSACVITLSATAIIGGCGLLAYQIIGPK